MSGMFDDFKEQVRSQANIVEIISEYVPLKKRGGSFWGCCLSTEKNTVLFRNAGQELFLLLWLSCWRGCFYLCDENGKLHVPRGFKASGK